MIGRALALSLAASASIAVAQEPPKPESIIVNHGGGGNGEWLRAAYFDDFEKETGIKIISSNAEDISKLRAMIETGTVEWALTELETNDAYNAADMGWLEDIDDTIVDQSAFPDEALHPQIFTTSFLASVIGYNTEYFPDGGPQNWAEFWDVERFPGPRSMRNHPAPNLEIALLADGVAPEDLYPLDVERAFAKLDEIKPDVAVWWTSGAQQAQALIDGEADVTTAWSTRMFVAQERGAPIGVSFDQGIRIKGVWGIPKGSPDAYWGQQLMSFMTDPERQAVYTGFTGSAGPDPSHIEFVDQSKLERMSGYPANAEKQIWFDDRWWADNGEEMLNRWNRWMLQ